MTINFEVKTNVTTTMDNLKKAMSQLKQLPQELHRYFVSITPIDTGNARRSTTLSGKTIHANYPYAKRLDEGWSKQAPTGMVKPTEKYLKRRLKEISGK